MAAAFHALPLCFAALLLVGFTIYTVNRAIYLFYLVMPQVTRLDRAQTLAAVR